MTEHFFIINFDMLLMSFILLSLETAIQGRKKESQGGIVVETESWKDPGSIPSLVMKEVKPWASQAAILTPS